MWRVLALSLFMIAVASGGFVRSFSQERTLRMTRVYLAFCAVVGSIQLAFWLLWPGVYYNAYWSIEFAHNVLLCLLSLEIIKALLPRRFVICWIGIAVAVPLVVLIFRLILKLPTGLGTLSATASFTSGISLTCLFLLSVTWTREHLMATAGVVSLLVGDLLSFFGSFGHSGPNEVSAVQLAPLLGLILLSLAHRSKQTDKPKHENPGNPPELPSEDLARGGTRPDPVARTVKESSASETEVATVLTLQNRITERPRFFGSGGCCPPAEFEQKTDRVEGASSATMRFFTNNDDKASTGLLEEGTPTPDSYPARRISKMTRRRSALL